MENRGVPPPPLSTGLLGTAVDHASADVPTAGPEEIAGEIRAALAGQSFDSADSVVVLEGGRFVGIVPIERLLAAPAEVSLAELVDPDSPVVAPGTDQEHAAWRMIEHGESSVAVVDEAGRYVGLISPHRMLRVLLTEHDEDIARLGGYLASTTRARLAAEEAVPRRLWHRLPWLLLGLLGAMASAGIVGAYERELSDKVLLAFFVPAVVYLADAVGTQTEAILIRGLSVGVSVRDVIGRELASGLVVGVILGAAFLAFAVLVWGDSRVAIAVAVSLFASCSIATAVAMLLPWAFQRAGKDPAFGSGPLATVIQDLLSIVVYLAIATAITG
jgi:magnesium transporter